MNTNFIPKGFIPKGFIPLGFLPKLRVVIEDLWYLIKEFTVYITRTYEADVER